MEKYYYIEKDGQIYLIEKNGKLIFPSEKSEFDFEITELVKMPFEDVEIIYCEPNIDYFPRDWIQKDTICTNDNAANIVKLAVNRSYVRHIAGALIIKDAKVLLVNHKMGTETWGLPGGFVTYGESPEDTVVREVKEETGLDVKPLRLIGPYVDINQKTQMYILDLIYLCKLTGGEMKLSNEELSEAKFMEIDEAIKLTEGRFASFGLRDYKRSLI